MTRYFRHLRDVFHWADIEATLPNKRAVDRVIHRLVGVDYKDYPATWLVMKAHLTENENAFVQQLHRSVYAVHL